MVSTLVLTYFLVISPFFASTNSNSEIKSLVLARKLEKGGFAATREFKSFEQVHLFITLLKAEGKHQAGVEWYNPQGDLETFHSLNFESKKFTYSLYFWLKLGQEDPLIGLYRGFENEGEWKVKIYLDDKFIKEEKFEVEAMVVGK